MLLIFWSKIIYPTSLHCRRCDSVIKLYHQPSKRWSRPTHPHLTSWVVELLWQNVLLLSPLIKYKDPSNGLFDLVRYPGTLFSLILPLLSCKLQETQCLEYKVCHRADIWIKKTWISVCRKTGFLSASCCYKIFSLLTGKMSRSRWNQCTCIFCADLWGIVMITIRFKKWSFDFDIKLLVLIHMLLVRS